MRILIVMVLALALVSGCAPEEKARGNKTFRSTQSVKFQALDLETGQLCEVTLFPGTEITVLAVKGKQ